MAYNNGYNPLLYSCKMASCGLVPLGIAMQ